MAHRNPEDDGHSAPRPRPRLRGLERASGATACDAKSTQDGFLFVVTRGCTTPKRKIIDALSLPAAIADAILYDTAAKALRQAGGEM